MPIKQCEVPQDEIARRAYEIWQSRGCPPGDGTQDWQLAEAELLATRVGRNGSTQGRLRSILGRLRQKVGGE
jgi:hypothetical protein